MFGTLTLSNIEIQLLVEQIDVFRNILAKISELEQSIVKEITGSAISLDINSMTSSVSDEHDELFNKLSHCPGHNL